MQSGKFFCGRKHKFGYNMQAVCDHRGRFLEVWITHPASASDFLTYLLSDFHHKVKQKGFLADGLVLFGDNAYVSNECMATPYKGIKRGSKDDYNFFQSQLRIQIECAFGMLTRRFGCFRKPLHARMGMGRQVALTLALCRLHNYCLGPEGEVSDAVPDLSPEDEFTVLADGGVLYGSRGQPDSLLHGGEHMDDVQREDRVVSGDMARRRMHRMVVASGLHRPLR